MAVSMSTLDIFTLSELTLPTTILVNQLSREHRIDTSVLGVSSLSQTLLIQSQCIGTFYAKHKEFSTKYLSKTTRKPKISSLISFSLNYLCQFAVFFMLHQISELSFYRTLLFASILFMLSFKEHFPSIEYSHHIKRNMHLQCHPY